MKLFILFCLLLVCVFAGRGRRIRDVCIIGAGASGMSSAVFLKDRGYDVLVLEKSSNIGGNCHTYNFEPPAPGYPAYVNTGVRGYFDTAAINATQPGSFEIDSKKFISRFADVQTITSLPPRKNYAVDFKNSLPPVATSPLDNNFSPEQLLAFGTLNAQLALYPWIGTNNIPNPIPAVLSAPFSDFITLHGLEALGSFFDTILGDYANLEYTKMSTLYALGDIKYIILTQVPGVPLSINGGCSSLYQGISRFLGEENILLDTRITNIERSGNRYHYQHYDNKKSNGKIRITYKSNQNKRGGYDHQEDQEVECFNLIVAFSPKKSELSFMRLTEDEERIFSNTRKGRSHVFAVNATEGVTADYTNIYNFDFTKPPPNIPTAPYVSFIGRDLPYGPSFGVLVNDYENPTSSRNVEGIITQQLTGIPSAFATAKLIDGTIRKHDSVVHFHLPFLSARTSPYERVAKIQGRLNTFYVGTLVTGLDYSVNIWDHTYNLIHEFFDSN
eukprot:TRINITY_DN10462_c0_g1_i1.p1 TRINITY_DN10462_c0_g1~~TRINITY_DN10462_c0_g1_i1.p1  ORF type:complete len:501 (-),score=133.03 TRINITY_DN10462_c0_g1_i1:45-1547(-)